MGVVIIKLAPTIIATNEIVANSSIIFINLSDGVCYLNNWENGNDENL